MLFWILVVVIAIVVTAVIVYQVRDSSYIEDAVGAGVAALLGTAFASVVVLLIVGAVNTQTVGHEDTKLRALNNADSELSGAFFLGFGYIDEEAKFAYFEEEEDGAITHHVVDTEDITLYEDATGQGYIRYDIRELDNGWILPWTITGRSSSGDFHIPPGSILENYTLEP